MRSRFERLRAARRSRTNGSCRASQTLSPRWFVAARHESTLGAAARHRDVGRPAHAPHDGRSDRRVPRDAGRHDPQQLLHAQGLRRIGLGPPGGRLGGVGPEVVVIAHGMTASKKSAGGRLPRPSPCLPPAPSRSSTPTSAFESLGFRISMRTRVASVPAGPSIVLVIRNWLVRRPPSFAWVLVPFRRSTSRAPCAEKPATRCRSTSARCSTTRPDSARRRARAARARLLGARDRADVAAGAPAAIRSPTSAIRCSRSGASRGSAISCRAHPLALFDANQFHPERLTLTYSDSLHRARADDARRSSGWASIRSSIYNLLLLLASFVLSGVTMFLLVRALTGPHRRRADRRSASSRSIRIGSSTTAISSCR